MASPIPVLFVEYNPEWPRHAESYARKFAALGDLILSIHHIGSTSVPGIVAKSVIDLMPVVSSVARKFTGTESKLGIR